jgi:hypothetical protein
LASSQASSQRNPGGPSVAPADFPMPVSAKISTPPLLWSHDSQVFKRTLLVKRSSTKDPEWTARSLVKCEVAQVTAICFNSPEAFVLDCRRKKETNPALRSCTAYTLVSINRNSRQLAKTRTERPPGYRESSFNFASIGLRMLSLMDSITSWGFSYSKAPPRTHGKRLIWSNIPGSR